MVGRDVPRVLINREAVGSFEYSQKVPEKNRRDVLALGDCDAQVLELAGLLGWKEELKALNATCVPSAFYSGNISSSSEEEEQS